MKNIEKIIKSILTSNQFKKEFFETINIKPTDDSGMFGKLIEGLVFKHLDKYFKNLITESWKIESKTNRKVDFIIDNNFFQLKTTNFNATTPTIKLFHAADFPNELNEQIEYYNARITNTIILVYDKINQKIFYFFLTYNNLLYTNKAQINERCKYFGFISTKKIGISYDFSIKRIVLNRKFLISKIKKNILIYNQISLKKQN